MLKKKLYGISAAIIVGLIVLVFLIVKCGSDEVQEKTYTKEDYDKLLAINQAKTRDLELERVNSVVLSKELMHCAQLQDSLADEKYEKVKQRIKDREENTPATSVSDDELYRKMSELAKTLRSQQ